MLGHFHTEEFTTEKTTVQDMLPDYYTLEKCHVAVNGTYLYDKWDTEIEPHSEVIVSVNIGWEWIIYIIVAIVVSVVLTVAMHFLFPVKPPKMEAPEKDGSSFSWQGIHTTQGPGNVVPILYGRHRVGGQLLSAYVEDRTNNNEFTIQDPVLHMLISIGEGEIEGFEADTLEINEQPIENYNQISFDTRVGTPDQTPISFFNQVKNTFDTGNIEFSESPTTYTTTTAVNGFIIHVDFALGLYAVNAKDGTRINNTSTWQYRYKPHSGGTWSPLQVVATSTDQRKIVHRPIKVMDLPLEVYDIEVIFVSAERTDDNAEYRPFLSKISEILDITENYENTALYGLRVVATENLQGSLPNVTIITKGKKVRQGGFLVAPTYSDNPSWCLMDFLTSTRYGAGIPDEEIDLASFIAFANYCNGLVDVDEDGDGEPDFQEKRCILSYVLDADSELPQVVDEILVGTRSALVKTEGLWKVKTAQDSAPVQLITWASTVRDSVSLTYIKDNEEVNVLEARYSNEDEDYEQDVLTYPRVEDWPNEIRKSSLEFRSVSRFSQVERETAFNMVARRYQKQILEFEMNIAGMIFEIMDVIQFSHPLPGYGWGGRVAERYGETFNTVRTVILDEEVPFVPGGTYHIWLQDEELNRNERLLVNPATGGETVYTRVVTLLGSEPNLTFTPTPGLTFWAFGKSVPFETALKEFRVTKVERSGDFTVRVTGVEHNPTIFDPFNASLLPSPSRLIRPDGPPPPLTQLIAFEEIFRDSTGNLNNFIVLQWDVMPLEEANALNRPRKYSPYGGALIYRRYVNGGATAGVTILGEFILAEIATEESGSLSGFNLVGSITGQFAFQYTELAPPKGTTLQYRVVPISQRGTPNYEGLLSVTITVTNIDNTPPQPPTNLVADGGIRQIVLSWQNPITLDLDGIEVWASKTNNRTTATKIDFVVAGATSYIHTRLGSSETWYYWIRAVDYADNVSPFHPESPTEGVEATTDDAFGDNLTMTGGYLFLETANFSPSGVILGEISIPDGFSLGIITVESNSSISNYELMVTYNYGAGEYAVYLEDADDSYGAQYGAEGEAGLYNTTTRMIGSVPAGTTFQIKLYDHLGGDSGTINKFRVMIYGFA